MANTLAQVYKNVIRCQSCGTLKSNSLAVIIVKIQKKNIIKYV